MSLRTLFLARMIGLYCILVALAMLLRGQSTVYAVARLLRDPPLMLVLGVITVAAGLAMVLVHNVWSGGAIAVIVMVIAWATLVKGLLFLILTPEAEAALFLKGLQFPELFYLYAGIALAIGACLTYGGFRKSAHVT